MLFILLLLGGIVAIATVRHADSFRYAAEVTAPAGAGATRVDSTRTPRG